MQQTAILVGFSTNGAATRSTLRIAAALHNRNARLFFPNHAALAKTTVIEPPGREVPQ